MMRYPSDRLHEEVAYLAYHLAERERARAAPGGDDIGLMAQDVEHIVPEVVHEGPGGYKHIRYGQLTALLVEAVKEQQGTIDRLAARVDALAAGKGN